MKLLYVCRSICPASYSVSLRFRINLIITALIVLFTLVTGEIIVDDTRRSIREEMEAGPKYPAASQHGALQQRSRARGGKPNGVLLSFLQNLGRVRAHEIRLYDSTGALLYTSPPSVYKAGRAAPRLVRRLVAPALPELESKSS